MNKQENVIKELQKVPGVGKAVAQDFYDLGFRSIAELKNQDAEVLYQKLCKTQNAHVDRCMLYTFRCAIYFAEEKNPNPKLLKWWNCKNKNLQKMRNIGNTFELE